MVDISLVRPEPEACQTENHVIDDTEYWVKVGRLDPALLRAAARTEPPLWLDGCHSFSGTNDRIPVEQADQLSTSLDLVYVSDPKIHVAQGKTKRQVRVDFRLGSTSYNLVVTDTKVETKYLAGANATHTLEGGYLFCVSIGEPFEGYRYKLAAAVIPLRQ